MEGLSALGGERPRGAGAGERADQGRAAVAVRGDREAGAAEGGAGGGYGGSTGEHRLVYRVAWEAGRDQLVEVAGGAIVIECFFDNGADAAYISPLLISLRLTKPFYKIDPPTRKQMIPLEIRADE